MHETIEVSPYSDIFEHIEKVQGISTFDAYLHYYEEVNRLGIDPSIYLSMAITSGGFARDESLSISESMQNNAKYAALLSDEIISQFQPELSRDHIVIPSELGKVDGWGQADYLLFWAHVITGLDPLEARTLDDILRNTNVMNNPVFYDKSLTIDERWEGYKALVDVYTKSLIDLGFAKGLNGAKLPRNIQVMILALDPAESLGVNAERYLAYCLGLGEYICEIAMPSSELAVINEELININAESFPMGDGNVYGKINHNSQQLLLSKGYKFRKSGVLAVIYKIISNSEPIIPVEKRTNEEIIR